MNYNYDYSTSNIVESPPDTETTWHGGFALSSTEESVLNGEQINNKEAIANPKSLEYFENLPELD